MKKILVAMWMALSACAGAPRAACSPEALDAIEIAYLLEGNRVINSGACDGLELDTCPAYQTVAVRYRLAYTEWEQCP
jgi:hypothetical protein